LLRQLADRGRTVLVSSHVLAEVAQTVDQVVIIARGRLVTQSTLAALTARTEQLVRVRTPQAEVLRPLLAAQGIQADPDGADQLLAVDTTTEAVGKTAAAAGVVFYEMAAERSNLEDVFLQLTSQQGAGS
jgi:ABC-2 type transport system ATP-binding protein